MSTPESMIGDAGILPFLMSCSSFTDSLPQPKYFWPSSTWTLPSRSRSSAGLDRVERDHLRLRRIDAGERVAREHRPAAHGDPRREIGVAARAGRDDLGAADHVFLDVVDLDDLDAGRLRQRLLHAVEPVLQVGGAEAVMIATLPLPFSSLIVCSPRMRPDARSSTP